MHHAALVKLGSLPTFAAIAHRKSWVAALSVRFLEIAQFSLRAQRRCAIRPRFRLAMSALGWELPLDAICVNGSYAQIATFAKSRERPKPAVHDSFREWPFSFTVSK
jgi:hypothetical protein